MFVEHLRFPFFFTPSPKFDEKTVRKVISETSNGTKKKKTAKSKSKTTSLADVVQEVSKVKRKNKKILGEEPRGRFHDYFLKTIEEFELFILDLRNINSKHLLSASL